MAHLYDTSFKELVTFHFPSLLPWLLPGVQRGEVVRLPEELPATLRRADLIVRSEPDGQPPTLFMVECQCQQDPDLAADMLLRAALAHRQHRLHVETVLLAFTPQAAVPDEYIFGGRGERASRHVVTVRRIYDEPAEAALALDIDALLPWVTAMCPANGDGEALLVRVLERVIDRVAPDSQRTLMLDQTATFATLRLPHLQVQCIVREVVRRRRYMLDPIRDFPWIRHGYEQGHEKGLAKGLEQGLERGLEQGLERGLEQGLERGLEQGLERGLATGMAQSVLAILAARHIAADHKLRDRVLSCQDPARLNEWITRAATATTAAEVIDDN